MENALNRLPNQTKPFGVLDQTMKNSCTPFYMKNAIHKIHLGVELLCCYILASSSGSIKCNEIH
jgi:hypothetical protein